MADAWGHTPAQQPHTGETYLVHESKNEGSDGWYTDQVADVLLRTGQGWHLADPDTGALLDEDADTTVGTGLDLDEDEETPPQAESPDGGDADTEKE